MRKRAVVDFLAKNGESTAFLIGEGIGLRGSRVRQLLGELAVEGIVVLNGGNRNRTYRLINGSA